MKRPLITGATGFIGGRLAEVLCARGTPPVALVRTWAPAARLSRLPVEIVAGDVLGLESLRAAMKGCDAVFHCAVDWRGGGRANRRSSIVGTQNVLQAALEARVQRVVFLSSTAVFGKRLQPGVLTEEALCPRTGDDYADGKIDAEKVALGFYQQHGLPVTILRPPIVYGPFSRSWTVATVAAIREGRMVLVNGGTGICNSLYVDNLVDTMLLSAEHPGAPGEVFHIADAQPVTWKGFIEGHARALGEGYLPFPEMTVEEIEAARARAARAPRASLKQVLAVLLRDPRTREAVRAIPVVARLERAGRWVAGTVLPAGVQQRVREMAANLIRQDGGAPPVREAGRPLLLRSLVQTHALQTVFSIEKARQVLGYAPKIDFSEGMERTAAWIQWAKL